MARHDPVRTMKRAELLEQLDAAQREVNRLRSMLDRAQRPITVDVKLPEELRPRPRQSVGVTIRYANGWTQYLQSITGDVLNLPSVPELFVPSGSGPVPEKVHSEETLPRRWWQLTRTVVRVVERWPSQAYPVQLQMDVRS